MNKNPAYKVKYKCTNCGGHYETEQNVGKTVEELLKEKPCWDCGCVTLINNNK